MMNSILTTPISLTAFLICIGVSLILGILTSLVFSYKNNNASLAFTLVILPVAMSMVVMMINGNLGVAVSVAGGFTLVRFRSIAGTGKEISAIFVVMALGVITGMGYIGIAAMFFAVIAITVLVMNLIHFGENGHEKYLKITLPENYDYTHLFDEVFNKYGVKATIEKVKTTNLGSLIDVTYKVTLKDDMISKEMLDELREKNANLEIVVSNMIPQRDQL